MKIKRNIVIAISILCIVGGSIKAQQTPGAPNELDNQFVPDKNSVFNSEGNAGEAKDDDSYSDINNIIKFNIGLLARSIAAFQYERRISDQITLEAGLGTCYNRDYVLSVSSEIFGFRRSNNEIGVSELMTSSDFGGKSLYSSFSFRLRYDSYYWESEPYFEINTRYYSNKFDITPIVNEYNSSYNGASILVGTSDITVRNTCINLIYGIQIVTDGKIATTHDFYTGFGMRSLSFNKVIRDYDSNNTGIYTYTNTSERVKGMGFSFVCGYAFGFGF